MRHWLFLLAFASVFYVNGAGFIESFVNYPSWALIGSGEFVAYHKFISPRVIGLLVVPVFLASVFTALLLWRRPLEVPLWAVWVAIASGGMGIYGHDSNSHPDPAAAGLLRGTTGSPRWVGRSIIAVGAVHCLVGALIFMAPLTEILTSGVWNAVDGHKGRPLAFWFVFTGLLTIVFGASIDWTEKARNPVSPMVAYAFGSLVLLAIIAMPFGGGWLLVPSAVGLLIKRQRG